MKQLLVSCQFLQKTKAIQLETLQNTGQSWKSYLIYKLFQIPENKFDISNIYLTSQSKIIEQLSQINEQSQIQINLKLVGGKGGFGTLMRNQANRRTKITNWDNSRDLQGRRIRNTTVEKNLIAYYKKKKEEDKKIQKAMEGYKKMQATLKTGTSDVKLKQEYKDKIDKIENNMASNIIQGLKKNNRFKSNKSNENNNDQLQDNSKNQEEEEEKKEEQEEEEQEEQRNQQQEESINLKKRKPSQEQNKELQQNEEIVKKQQTKSTEQKENSKFERIDQMQIKELSNLDKYEDEHIKFELQQLGLKAGGRPQDRKQRLWDVIKDPSKLFHPKYLAKK